MYPRIGISFKIGTLMESSLDIALPTYSAPIRPDKPVPKIVNASPVATWFVASINVKNPNIKDVNKPDKAPVKIAKYGFPVVITVIEAMTAPINIIPSTPKFKIPLFSTTNSPVAAYKIGIDDKIITIKSSIIV